ncbi:uncharacterized protein LOC101235895 isoform X1 [Hydra vulgaris]|uniref:uncharacterized protein LOC101235895 isoform X1 n=1 Tax=Hydra vulgaris TaxID=6087 RepID=UPI0002B452DF|nr:uncharacterized protein LOC101235895 [Hydra vulgaris]
MSVGLNVDYANPYTNQIFQEAVARNDFAVVKLLLKFGIHPKRNERNVHGLTALQQAVLDGHTRMAVILLEGGADIEAKTSNGWTCLHIAAAIGDLDMLITLIGHCADLIALTKNEELPIDLAATNDIKIKLAKEMSRIGYSELAQWYMRKLAAQEGMLYVLSTDTLLDMACDDNYDSNNTYPYVIRNIKYENEEVFTDCEAVPFFNTNDCNENKNFWQVDQEKMKYLSSSSGYVSEMIFDKSKDELTKMGVKSCSVNNSPIHKNEEQQGSYCDEPEMYGNNDTLRRTASMRAHSQTIQRNPSKLELHIDYTNSAEDDEDDPEISPASQETSLLILKPEENCNNRGSNYQIRNVRFDNFDNANEFCNCPNCKKMGYAFSPDIRVTGRKLVQVQETAVNRDEFSRFSYSLNNGRATGYPSSQYYPATTTNTYSNYGNHEKPRKRRNKLLSGIKSIFKESIKVQKGSAEPIVNDAGILFAVSLRDRNKSKSIRQKHSVRKSNSFSDKTSHKENYNEEFMLFSHEHVVHAPSFPCDILNSSKVPLTTESTVRCEFKRCTDYFNDNEVEESVFDLKSSLCDDHINIMMSEEQENKLSISRNGLSINKNGLGINKNVLGTNKLDSSTDEDLIL